MASYLLEIPAPLPQPEPQIHLTLSPEEVAGLIEFIDPLSAGQADDEMLRRRRMAAGDAVYQPLDALVKAQRALELA